MQVFLPILAIILEEFGLKVGLFLKNSGSLPRFLPDFYNLFDYWLLFTINFLKKLKMEVFMFKKAIFLFLALTLYSCGRDLDRNEDYSEKRDYRDYNSELEDMTYMFLNMMDFVLDRYDRSLESLYEEIEAHDRTVRKYKRIKLEKKILDIQYNDLRENQYESFKLFKDELEDSKKSLILAESLAQEEELKNHLNYIIAELTEMEEQIDEILKEIESSIEEEKEPKSLYQQIEEIISREEEKESKAKADSEEDKSSSAGEAEDSSAGADSENIGLTGVKLSEGDEGSSAGVDAGAGEAEDTQATTDSGEAEVLQEEAGSGETDAGSEDTGADLGDSQSVDSDELESSSVGADSGSEATEGAGLDSQAEADSSTQIEADSPEAQDSQEADSSPQVEADSQGAEATGANVGSGDPISVSIEAKGLPSDQTIVIKLEEEASDN